MKLIEWFKTAGLRSIGYLAAGFGCKVLFSSELLLGIGLGIFLADNWVTIRALIKKTVDEIKDK